MKLFQQRDLKQAYLHAEAGGQALLLLKKKNTGRLIDHHYERLYATGRRLGLRAITVERGNAPGQSLVIENHPLARALAECQTPEFDFA